MRAIIVEDSPILREGLSGILAGSRLQVVAVCATAEEGLRYARALAPEVAFLGASLAAARDHALLDAMRRASPETRCVLVSTDRGAGDMVEALRRGASCYLRQGITLETLLLAAQAAAQGFVMADSSAIAGACTWPPRHVADGAAASAPSLTARQSEVLVLLCRGLNNRQIAERLTVTVGTVRTHVSNILAKLQVSDRVQAAVWATAHGLDRPAS